MSDSKSPETWSGQRVKRFEDPGMLTGALTYITDVSLPRMLEMAFFRSPMAHARITEVDVSAALETPGVRAVFQSADFEHVPPTVDIMRDEASVKTPRPTMPADRARFVGEPLVAVVADDRYTAEDGVEAVIVDLEEINEDEPIHEGLLVDDKIYHRNAEHGDVDAAFTGAANVVKRRIGVQRLVASPMETSGIIADFDSATGELTCHVAIQMPHLLRVALAESLGMSASRIRVLCPAMGGSFGSKETLLPEYLAAIVASMRLGRPVRWVEDRSESLTAGVQAKEAEAHLDAAFDDEGQLTGMRASFINDSGAYSSGIGAYTDFLVAAATVPGLYNLPSYTYDAGAVITHKAPIGPVRGVGGTTSQLVREVLLDDAARALDIDRMELRRRNMVPDGEWKNILDEDYEAGTWRSAFERSLELIGYDAFLEQQAAARGEGRLLGIGVSPFVEVAALGADGAVGMPGGGHDNATVSIDASGGITVSLPTFSHGQGHHTTTAQLVADQFGVEPSAVRIIDGDTARTPFGMGTYGSRSAVYIAGTVTKASAIVLDKVQRIAAMLLKTEPENIELANGMVGIKGVPEAKMPLAAVAGAAHFALFVRHAVPDPSLTATAFFNPGPATHSNGSIATTVEVDPQTGSVVIDRIVVTEDCGRIINPMIVDGQIRGGIAQGVGVALCERYLYDEDAQPQTTTFAEYLLPRAVDLPAIEIEHLESQGADGTSVIKGMAEGTAIAAPAAIVCAVLDAIAPFGAGIEELPLRPEVIADALAAADVAIPTPR